MCIYHGYQKHDYNSNDSLTNFFIIVRNICWILSDLKFEAWRVAYDMRLCLNDLKGEDQPEIISKMEKLKSWSLYLVHPSFA